MGHSEQGILYTTSLRLCVGSGSFTCTNSLRKNSEGIWPVVSIRVVYVWLSVLKISACKAGVATLVGGLASGLLGGLEGSLSQGRICEVTPLRKTGPHYPQANTIPYITLRNLN